MNLIKPSFEILSSMDSMNELIERAGRVCYKSKINSKKRESFIEAIIKSGHESVIEHSSVTVSFIIDRGISHELVRHRMASFSQESTRYCNYSKDKFNKQLTFIIPPWVDVEPGEYELDRFRQKWDKADYFWLRSLQEAETCYLMCLKMGWSPEQARTVLPNSLKTEIVMTANVREWRHVFKLRCSKKAHPQIREIMTPLYCEFEKRWPALFSDIDIKFKH